jgi:hypothetical protein
MIHPQHYAIVVGINAYPDEEVERLNSPLNDARSFATWLTDPEQGGVPDENVEPIFSTEETPAGALRRDGKPTKTQIHEALYDLCQRCKAHISKHPLDWQHTRLYVYVSGHGIAPTPSEAALLMANAGPDWYGENFPCGSFLEFFREAQYFKELVFFADCCRHWVDDAPLAGPTWTKVDGNNGKVFALAGYATFFGDPAYEPTEDELEPGDERRSFFTEALIEGLRGKAVDPSTHRIDSASLAKYVKARVLKLTEKKRSPQTPQFPGDLAELIVFKENITLAEISSARTQTVTITVATPFDGEIVLVSGTLRELERHDPVPAPWVVTLKDGLYRVKPTDPAIANPFNNDGYIEVIGADLNVEL